MRTAVFPGDPRTSRAKLSSVTALLPTAGSRPVQVPKDRSSSRRRSLRQPTAALPAHLLTYQRSHRQSTHQRHAYALTLRHLHLSLACPSPEEHRISPRTADGRVAKAACNAGLRQGVVMADEGGLTDRIGVRRTRDSETMRFSSPLDLGTTVPAAGSSPMLTVTQDEHETSSRMSMSGTEVR
jgi:hypothetical protein